MGGKSNVDISQLPLWKVLTSAFGGAAIAELATLPLDTIKVTMQVHQGKYKGTLDCTRGIIKNEGVAALWKGWYPGVLRQFFYGMTRIGIYDYMAGKVTHAKGGSENVSFLDRVGLGIFSGGLAMCIGNPTDVIKVKLQTQDPKNPRYKGTGDAFLKVLKKEGIIEFYRSLPANVIRNSVTNAAEMASYDQIKYTCINLNILSDGMPLHFLSSGLAGFIATVVSSPFDVIKSNIMSGKTLPNKKVVPFKGMLDATRHIQKTSGFKGFYQGFSANCQRIISWNIVMFMVREQFLLAFYTAQKK